jgi:hypothetical protein
MEFSIFIGYFLYSLLIYFLFHIYFQDFPRIKKNLFTKKFFYVIIFLLIDRSLI